MTRLTTNDFPPEVLELYDRYAHSRISRRDFLDQAAKYALGGLTAAGMLASLRAYFAAWSRKSRRLMRLWA